MQWQVWLGIILSVVFGLMTVSQVDFQHLGAALRSADYPLLILAGASQVLTLLVRAWRWQYLLASVKPTSLPPLVSATAIGFLANMLFPAHAGEVVRAYVLSRREGMSTMTSLATIVVERVADLVGVLLLLSAVLWSTNMLLERTPVAEHLRTAGYVAALLCVGLIGGLWFLRVKTTWILPWLSGCFTLLPPRWQQPCMTALASFALGLQALDRGRHVVAVLVLSLLLWLVVACSNVFVFYAFGLQLPLAAAFLVLGLQILGVAIPAAPGFIGTYHAAVVTGLVVFEVVPELALSMAIMMHATFFLPFVLIGLIFLWRESLSLRALHGVNVQRPG
jgi:hypothetical protein